MINKKKVTRNLKTRRVQNRDELFTNINSPQYNGLNSKGEPLPMPVLFPDSNFDFQTDFGELQQIYKNHGLTKGEVRMIFNIIDMNADSQIAWLEWSNYRRIFVEPFEKCDEDKDYKLNEKE